MKVLKTISIVLAIFLVLYACTDPKPDSKPAVSIIEPPVPISSVIPIDVDPAIQAKLKGKNDNLYGLNQAFNKFGWQAFVAIFWPLDDEGNPLPNFTDEGTSTWLTWKEAFEVYLPNGGVPAPWGSPRLGVGLGHDKGVLANNKIRVYLGSETPAHKGVPKNIADEEEQAFAGKLFDQKGNIVYYEVLMNKEEYDYVVANKLYNINGQVDFTKDGQIANFPKGDFAKKTVGAIEIKAAWKILTDTDYKERYYQNEGYIFDKNGNLVLKKLGLIGFHISQKTPTGKQWVWSTFEHIDNLDQNTTERGGREVPIHPTLRDPYCEICPINIDLDQPGARYTFNNSPHGNFWTYEADTVYANSETMITQAKRMIDIPIRVQQLNRLMQVYFKSQNSVFQYYQLIDTQYPTDQDAPPGNHTQDGYQIPASIVNKPGGNPNLAYLTNITMETFFQGGNQSGTSFMETKPNSNKSPATPINVFGTESCMGCHSSAGIYTSLTGTGPQLSGDFSWLLSQKAKIDSTELNAN